MSGQLVASSAAEEMACQPGQANQGSWQCICVTCWAKPCARGAADTVQPQLSETRTWWAKGLPPRERLPRRSWRCELRAPADRPEGMLALLLPRLVATLCGRRSWPFSRPDCLLGSTGAGGPLAGGYGPGGGGPRHSDLPMPWPDARPQDACGGACSSSSML